MKKIKIKRVYNIVLCVVCVFAIYDFVYERFLHEYVYLKYVHIYFNSGKTFPKYSIGEIVKEPDIYELYGIPFIKKQLHKIFKISSDVLILIFIPMFVCGIILFFINKKYNWIWLFMLLVVHGCILYIIYDILSFIYD
jgi:hypothetical protein